MTKKRKPQSNFICDPDGPSGIVYDTMLHEENFVPQFRIIDYPLDDEADKAIVRTIQKLKQSFTQFKENLN